MASAAETADGCASRSTLTHGDLHGGNLLVDEHGDVCAVVDWGDVHLGDPAVDLAVAHTVIPTSAHPVFRETYGTITEPAWQVARIINAHLDRHSSYRLHRHD